MKRLIINCTAIILCMAILFGQTLIASATDTGQYVSFDVPIISNECPELSFIRFYKYNGTYYLPVKDIIKLTRFKVLEEDEYTISLEQGERIISISKEDGHLLDCGCIDQEMVPIQYYNGEYMLEGIPMLTYLGATCTVTEKGYLNICVPWITYWEATMPNYEEYCFDINALYGSEASVKVSLICDIIADLMDVSEGGILPAGKSKRYQSALYETLKMDMNSYEGVQKLTAWKNAATDAFLSSETVTAIFQSEFERIQQTEHVKSTQQERDENSLKSNQNGAEFYELAQEMLEESMDVFWEKERQGGIENWQNAFSDGNAAKMAEAAAENSEVLYHQAYAKSALKKMSGYQDFLDVVMVTANVIGTANDLMKCDIATRELLKDALSTEIIKNAGCQDLAWIKAVDSVSKSLSTDTNILIDSAYNEITNFAVERIVDEGVPALLSLLTSNANVYYVVTKMALFALSIVFDDLFQAYASDMVAIDTNEIHRDVLEILNATKEKARNEKFSNIKTLEQLKSLYTLYYRLILSFSDKFAASLKEFGGENKDEWIVNFAGKECGSYSNYAAEYLYMITNCSVQPILEYNSNVDKYKALFRQYDPTEEQADHQEESEESESASRSAAEIAESITGLHCEWAVEGDFNNDSNDEIYALLCTSNSDHSNGQLWQFTSIKNRCIFYIEETEFETLCDIAQTIPDWLAVELIDAVDSIDEFISDIERYYS